MDKSDKILPSASPTENGMKNTFEATDYFLGLFFLVENSLSESDTFSLMPPQRKIRKKPIFLEALLCQFQS